MKAKERVFGCLLVVLSMVIGISCAAAAESLVIYTNSGIDGRDAWLTEKAAEKGFAVSVVTLPAGELANRVVAERNNQIADLVYGLNAMEYEKLINNKLLLKFKPNWAKDVDMTLGKMDYYYPIVVQPLLLIYNQQSYSTQTAPSDWLDLVKPEFKDKYHILALGGGTAKAIIASILVRYSDPKGQYGISVEGWAAVKNLIQNGHIEIQGEDIWGNLISGRRPMAMMWGSGLLQNQAARNQKFGYMSPKVGVPFVVEQVAIFANTKKADLAKEFVEWFGSASFQAEWSAKFGATPAQPAALVKAKPEVKELMASVTPQKIDWALVAANIDKWMEKIQLEFVR